jgi:peptidoglycan hydrolase-like protein with peptidoglycan-binding domain
VRKSNRITMSAAVATIAATALTFTMSTSADARVGAGNLSIGSTGSGVWCVQRIINRVYGVGLAEDSRYGPRTADAVAVFQARHSIRNDGIVGPITGSYLLDAVHGDNYCYNFLPTVN